MGKREHLIKPKDVSVKDIDGNEKAFVVSRFPAVAGREIVSKYPLSALPKLGDYAVNEETMLKAMAYVGVPTVQDEIQMLTTRALVDSHVTDFEMLMRLEAEVLGHNTSFFQQGKTSAFFAAFGKNLRGWISSTLTDLLVESLQAAKQHTKS